MDRPKNSSPDFTPTALMAEKSQRSFESSEESSKSRFVPGEQLAGRFQIIRWIANGGMGEVYEALDAELGTKVAVKVIRPEIAANTKTMERFRREISLARLVTHPNVCRIFEFFYHRPDSSGSGSLANFQPLEKATAPSGKTSAEGDVAFLTMELLDGKTLSEYLPAGVPLSTEQALPIVRQMATALAAAHEAGVVHRDFKCSNVMVVEGAETIRTVVTDFGLARSLMRDDQAVEVTVQGEILGSPAYMAPEQITGDELTSAVDLYALGVVVYRLVTGRLPFEGLTPLGLLAKRIHEDPPSPKTIVKDLAPSWDAAIMKCLAKNPEDRFTSARDLLSALEPTPSPLSTTPLGTLSSRRLAVWALLLLCIFSIAMVVPHLRVQNPAVQSPTATEVRSSIAVLGFNNLSKREDAAWLSTALAELLTTELAASERLRIIPGENVVRMQHDLDLPHVAGMASDTLQRIGQHLGSEYVVLGSYLAAGDAEDRRLRLDLNLQSTTTGQTLETLSETVTEAELLPMVDRLGTALRTKLGDKPTAGAHASMPANAQAARLYAEGIAELHTFNLLEARDLLIEAAAADPQFPLTHAALATAYSTLGYDAEAVEQIRLAFENSEDSPRQERLLIEGQFRRLTGNWDGAVDSYRTLFESFPDDLEYGLELVQAQVKAGRSGEAEETLKSLREFPPPASEDPRIDVSEFEIAFTLAQYPRALEAARQAYERSRQIGARFLAARAKHLEGTALWNLGRLAEAEEVAREAYQGSLDLGDLGGSARAMTDVGTILFLRNEIEASLSAHNEALEIYREIGFRSGLFNVLNRKANSLFILGDLEPALQLREEALDLARAIGVKRQISVSLSNLAQLCQVLGDSTKALQLLEESLDITRQIGNPRHLARRLLALSVILMERDPDTARVKIQEALPLLRELDTQVDLDLGLRILAHLDMVQDDFESARRHLDLSMRQELEKESGNFETRYYLAELAYKEDRLEDAIKLASDLAQQFEKFQRPLNEAGAQSILAFSNLSLGRLETARAAYERTLELVPEVLRGGVGIHLACIEAQLLAAEGQPEAALTLLEEELTRTQQAGRLDLHFETNLVMGEIELRHGRAPAGLKRLSTLAREAESKGFYFIARKAQEATEASTD